ncbi:LuxR family two component transcriptional regulator [Pedobacter psychrotolerans]|uniref:DNA-binding response regulator n=1 Tax=Pedobacter psychrotolerans TaxID=1843235 RepID=A0A4R2H684_9SPHI|nr:response regulator transcription factor [Pedobacter psychrotolerans]TCO21488.1 LuxR family two component transcriptional regulator [Pedobacter psychrotolerans]GGE39027.1 DNA-binding response regulator [Pedobacter psychrotolerans]
MKRLITIAIVEDNASIREMLQSIIAMEESYLCTGMFGNGEDALKGIPELQPDVVLMDIGLPGINGIDCIKQLKPTCPRTEFLICTIYDEDEKVYQALEYGASSYILKSSKPEFLLQSILEVHNGGSPMSPDIARKLVQRFRQKENKNAAALTITPREKEILELLSQGLFYKEASDQLGISINTLKRHIYNMYQKLQVDNKTEAINKVFGK